jgi:glucose-1-phosphate thymidylyltransferase
MVKRGYKVGYSELEKWWKDTGNPRDILEANQRMLDDISSRNDGMVDQHSVLQGKVIIGKDTKVVNSMIRGPAVIGEKNTIRDAYIGPYTAIDRECTIESAEVENSIIMENCAIINIRSRISDSLIGSNVEIISNDELPATASFVIGDKCKIKIK